MAQTHRAKAFLEAGNTLTSLIGLNELGIMDVPKVMSLLKEQGYEFKKGWLKVVNRYGEKTKVRTYWK